MERVEVTITDEAPASTLTLTTTTSTTEPPPTTPPTAMPSAVSLPAIDAATVEPSRSIVDEPMVRAWFDAATAISGNPAADCAQIPALVLPLAGDVLDRVVMIPEAVVQELAFDLDAAATAASAYCERGDSGAALDEWSAAVALSKLVAVRLEELA